MCRDLSYLRDVHIIAKILAFLCLFLSLILLENPVFFFVFLIFTFAFFCNYYLLGVESLLFFLSFFFPFFFFLLKLLDIFLLCYLLVSIISMEEIRTFLEVLFYGKYPPSISYQVLSCCHFCKCYQQNVKDFHQVYQMYGKSLQGKDWINILKKSYEKSKRDVFHYFLGFQYRFYRMFPKRTYYEKAEVTSLDMKYVLASAILLFFVFVYGRS